MNIRLIIALAVCRLASLRRVLTVVEIFIAIVLSAILLVNVLVVLAR